jgi:NAD(P)-dependent dehydrogenase (short-subunit alcohol dehydrogenase family)
MNSQKKAIIITGATKRLGLLLAKKSLAMGYSVIMHFRSEISEDSYLLQKQHPDDIAFIQFDLTNNPETLISMALNETEEIIGLVNNASIFTQGNLCNPSDFMEKFSINTLAPLKCSAAFYKHIKNGWIINITDANIKRPNDSFQNYRISKLFLEEITRQQAVTFAPDVRVNAIAPGAMLPAQHENDYFSSLSDKVPLKSVGNTDSLISSYDFLVNNNYLTGEIIHVDGGWGLL